MKISFELKPEQLFEDLHARDIIEIIKDAIADGFNVDKDGIKNLRIE